MAARFDEIRIVRGKSVWTANFTPPASPYTISGGDVAAFNGTVTTAGSASFNAVEAADVVVFTGTLGLASATGSLVTTEASDTVAFTGTVTWSAGLAATEAADAVAFSGTVAAATPITGSLGAVEASDIVYFDARGRVSGGWIDYGRVRRRKARGLRQAERFFEKIKAEAEEKKRELVTVAKSVRETQDDRPGTDAELAAFAQLQQRQQQIIDNMLAQAAARVAQARQELAQLEAMQRTMDMDEEDAITVLLLQ
jgi:hypothetical protein